jgi:hypothetical protein
LEAKEPGIWAIFAVSLVPLDKDEGIVEVKLSWAAWCPRFALLLG